MKIILTGFGRFGRYISNPTEVLAVGFRDRRVGHYVITPLVFAASMEVAWGLFDAVYKIREILDNDVKAIVSLGLSSQAKGFKFERSFVNWVDSPYCNTDEVGRPVRVDRPVKEVLQPDSSKWDWGKIRWELGMKGVPVEFDFSNDPGAFCCNALGYCISLALMMSVEKPPAFLFAHVPCTPESVRGIKDPPKILISQSQLEMGFEAIISGLLH